VFSPIELETDPPMKDGSALPNLEALRRKVVLADGRRVRQHGPGVARDNVDIVLVSDAGRATDGESAAADYAAADALARVRDIAYEHDVHVVHERLQAHVVVHAAIGQHHLSVAAPRGSAARCRPSIRGSVSSRWARTQAESARRGYGEGERNVCLARGAEHVVGNHVLTETEATARSGGSWRRR